MHSEEPVKNRVLYLSSADAAEADETFALMQLAKFHVVE